MTYDWFRSIINHIERVVRFNWMTVKIKWLHGVKGSNSLLEIILKKYFDKVKTLLKTSVHVYTFIPKFWCYWLFHSNVARRKFLFWPVSSLTGNKACLIKFWQRCSLLTKDRCIRRTLLFIKVILVDDTIMLQPCLCIFVILSCQLQSERVETLFLG